MNHNPTLRLASTLRPLDVRDYALAKGWEQVPGVRGRLWVLRHPSYGLRQLQIPMDVQAPDWTDALEEVSRRLSDIENRPVEAVLQDLSTANADLLRFRLDTPDTESGQLSLSADIELRQGARRALLASACSVKNPAPYHPRMSRSEAEALVASCRAGQTELGSYVVTIVCPLYPPESPTLLQEPPFSRQATSLLMRSLSELVQNIESNQVDEFLQQQLAAPLMSANLCDALLRMQPEKQVGQLEISASWSPKFPQKDSRVPSRVGVKAEYFPVIDQVAQRLRPTQQAQENGPFIGTVEALGGEVGLEGRRAGEVTLALFSPDNEEPIRVRANLNADQYEKAVLAHSKGHAYIRAMGLLKRGPKMGRLDPLQDFRLLDEPMPTR